jgi:hypothetical protein
MKRNFWVGLCSLFLGFIILAGCAPASTVTPSPTPEEPTETSVVFSKPTIPYATLTPGITPSRPAPTVTIQRPTAVPSPTIKATAPPDLTKTDSQGQVSVSVNPVNLTSPGNTLVFDVSMNTHSVDLSMDISKLSRLTTESGKAIAALKWDGPLGGHHVQGKLSFPAGEITGSKKITLTISNVDVPSRVFTWSLEQ